MQLLSLIASYAAGGVSRKSTRQSHSVKAWLLMVFSCCLMMGWSAPSGWALQRHPLAGQPSKGESRLGTAETTGTAEHAATQPELDQALLQGTELGPGLTGTTPGHAQTPGQAPPQASQQPAGKVEKHEALPATKEVGPGVEAEKGAHAEHGVTLPELSPVPGVTFVETLIKVMDHELHGRTLGWRPNDLVIGRFTDDINNYQLGVLEAVRFTTLRLKDSLTRMGDADAYDRDLESALNLFMNRATLFWFPSAEGSYDEALGHLRKFLQKLQTGQRNFYYRVDNLLSLIAVYKDLLGNVNRSLIMASHADGTPVSWSETDDYFYYAKGVAHVLYEILKVVRVGFKAPLDTLRANEIMDEVIHELHRVEVMDPWIILDSDLDGFMANHRANLNAPLSEVAHLLTVMSQF
jgi:hypothetical protein